MLGYTPADRLCLCVPLFHCFGCVIGVLGAFTHGACLCAVEAFDPTRVLETIDRERCTALYGVPTMFIAELEHPDFARYDLTSLRTGVMAGALCPGAADAARDDRDASAGDHDRLRDDRGVAGHHDDAAGLRRSRSDRRPSARCCRSSR